MCRIAGWRQFNKYFNQEESVLFINKMTDCLREGGPDADGYYISDDNNIVFGHRRLSILDLSNDGSQPMLWKNWVISYNGEIYNYKQIRNELITNGYNFISNTDTEVIIKAFDLWGISAVKKFIGMFAFALLELKSNKMYLCRDRLGVKPLYYYLKDGFFMFSSELKAFHEIPHFDKTINFENLNSFFSRGYFNENESIFKYVNKVKPGTIIELDSDENIQTKVYWDLMKVFEKSEINSHSLIENITELDLKINDSIKRRMVSDVEVGVFLSGGVDSSLIAALLKKNSTGNVKSFTIGFEDKEYDESFFAKKIANELKLDHKHIYCSNAEMLKILPTLYKIYDEPFADISSIPTILVSKLASKSVKVVLSGDGGDELFGGYSKYKFIYDNLFILKVPLFVRKIILFIFNILGEKKLKKIIFLFASKKYSNLDEKYFKLKQTLISDNISSLFNSCSSHVDDRIVNRFTNCNFKKSNLSKFLNAPSLVTRLGIQDLLNYLPGDILQKVDRASMSVGLEAREPLLDHELVEYSFTIPDKYKITNNGETKFILKEVLRKYISKDLIDRPKSGFSVPINNWLQTFLLDDLNSLSNNILFFDYYKLDNNYFNILLESFKKGKNIVSPHFFWYVLTLYYWHNQWIANDELSK